MRELEANVGRLAPPFGNIHLPQAKKSESRSRLLGARLGAGRFSCREIRTSTELGPAGIAMLGGKWPSTPDLPRLSPAWPTAGWGSRSRVTGAYSVGLTLVAKDGGTTVLERPIVVLPAPPPSPTPRR